MKKGNITREILIDSTIKTIAHYGLSKSSTRVIADNCGINDALIFRFLCSKDDMICQAFGRTDDEIFDVLSESYNDAFVLSESDPTEEKCKKVFFALWDYLIKNKDKCMFYSKFYYSTMFDKSMRRDHMKKYETLADEMQKNLGAGDDGFAVVHEMFDVTINLAVRALRKDYVIGDVRERSFKIVYAVLKEFKVK